MGFFYFTLLGGLVAAGVVTFIILRILRAKGALADWSPEDHS